MKQYEDLKIAYDNLYSVNQMLYKEMERLNNLITDVKDLIDHELNCHILKNDEETWNLEYYTNGKLDYRKLLIGLLTDINSRLGGKND